MSVIPRPASVTAERDAWPATNGLQLFGSMAVYGAANVLSGAIPLLLLPVLTRVLSPADFGLAAMFSVVLAMLVPVVGLGTKHAFMVRFFGEHGGDMGHFLTTCLTLTAASSALLALLVLPFHRVLTAVTQLPAGWLLLAVAAAAGKGGCSAKSPLSCCSRQSAS
jgi:O-antigen/teichoic acid export membrane protein